MITKEIAIDQITVLENGTILVREVTSIIEDGAILSSTYHRTSYEVGSDSQGMSQMLFGLSSQRREIA